MTGNVIQLFGHVLAYLTQGAATSSACLAGRQDLIFPIQVIWQRLTAVLALVGWGVFITGRLPGVVFLYSLRDLIVF